MGMRNIGEHVLISPDDDTLSTDYSQALYYLLNRTPTPLYIRQPKNPDHVWVFWGKNHQGLEINSSSAAYKIKSTFYLLFLDEVKFLAQLWVPETIGGRRLLSTSGQPFAAGYFSKDLASFRLHSEKYKYDIDMNKRHTGDDPMIKSDGPATTFLKRLPYMGGLTLLESESCFGLKSRILLPICLPSPSDCIGVLEITTKYMGLYVLDVVLAIKEAGLDVCNGQQHLQHLPFKTKDEIKHALEMVCRSHNLCLAQAWIGFEDKNHVPLTSSSRDTRRMLGLKLASYAHEICFADENFIDDFSVIGDYDNFSDVFPLGIGYEHVFNTLQDFKPRYVSKLRAELLTDWELLNNDYSAFAICLRSRDIGDFFVFQYIWPKQSRCEILLEAILLTLKRVLPTFMFASGVEFGDELDVIEVGCPEEGQTINDHFKLFQAKQLSKIPNTLDKGKQKMVVDTISPATTLEVLPREAMPRSKKKINITREDIEKHYGKSMKDASKILEVSIPTLKRKLRMLGMPDWPKQWKRKKSDLPIHQKDTNEAENVSTQNPLTMTVKALYAGDMIKISHLNTQATFETIKNEIGMKFKLSVGTYNLAYKDEDEDWVLFESDEELRQCIQSSRKSDRILIRVRVQRSTNTQS